MCVEQKSANQLRLHEEVAHFQPYCVAGVRQVWRVTGLYDDGSIFATRPIKTKGGTHVASRKPQ